TRSEPPATMRLPLCGSIAAGQPIEAVRTAETIAVPADLVRGRGTAFVLRVIGDSKIDEQIRSGDFVVVEERATARDGETVVALIDGTDATLKRFRRDGSMIRLEPANPAMRPIVVAAETVRIQGVVVGLIRKY